jgi:hypothetical protein
LTTESDAETLGETGMSDWQEILLAVVTIVNTLMIRSHGKRIKELENSSLPG